MMADTAVRPTARRSAPLHGGPPHGIQGCPARRTDLPGREKVVRHGGRTYYICMDTITINTSMREQLVDITEQVKAQPRGGVIVITGLEVSDEDGESGGSGFDVEVGDWGDRHEYELPV